MQSGSEGRAWAAAEVPAFTTSTTFTILQSIRIDLGTGSQIHP